MVTFDWIVTDELVVGDNAPILPKPTFPGAPSHIINQPGEQQKALGKTDVALAKDRDQLLREDAIMRMWLDGKPMGDIIRETGLAWATVKSYIVKGRESLKAALEDDINNLAAERIEGFRDIKHRALSYLDLQPKNAPQLLKVVMDVEINIGKIQGVLNDKVVHLGTIKHEHQKMYDFVDMLPEAPGTIAGEYKELPTPINPPQTSAQDTSPLAEWHELAYAAVPSTSDLTRTQRSAAQRNNTQSKENVTVVDDEEEGFPEGVEFIIG